MVTLDILLQKKESITLYEESAHLVLMETGNKSWNTVHRIDTIPYTIENPLWRYTGQTQNNIRIMVKEDTPKKEGGGGWYNQQNNNTTELRETLRKN